MARFKLTDKDQVSFGDPSAAPAGQPTAAPAPGGRFKLGVNDKVDFLDTVSNNSAAPQPSGPGRAESFARGAAQGASLGFADEIVGGIESLFTDKKYTRARDEYRANDKAAQAAHGGYFLGGNIAGGVATAFVPGLGAAGAVGKGAAAGAKAAAVGGAKVGAISGLGASEADLTKGDAGAAFLDAAQGAALGGLVGAAGGAIAARKGSLVSGAAMRGENRLIKDLTGVQTRAPATPSQQAAIAKARNEVIEAAKEFNLGKVASKPTALSQTVDYALDVTGKRIGEVYEKSGALVPLGKVTKALRDVAEKYESNPATVGMAKSIRRQIDEVIETWTALPYGRAARGAVDVVDNVADGVTRRGIRVPASNVHQFVSQLGKVGFAKDAYDPSTVALMRREAWGSVKDVLMESLRKADPKGADGLKRLNRIYVGLSALGEAAANRAEKDIARRVFSGVDATLFGAGMLTGNPVAGLAAIAGKKFVQEGLPALGKRADAVLARLARAAQKGSKPAEIAAMAIEEGVPRAAAEEAAALASRIAAQSSAVEGSQ